MEIKEIGFSGFLDVLSDLVKYSFRLKEEQIGWKFLLFSLMGLKLARLKLGSFAGQISEAEIVGLLKIKCRGFLLSIKRKIFMVLKSVGLKSWVLMVCLLVVLMSVEPDMFCLVFRSLVVDVFGGVEEFRGCEGSRKRSLSVKNMGKHRKAFIRVG